MTSSDLSELIGKVKAATGPDRQIDWHIADVTDHPSFEKRFEHMWPPFGEGSKLDRDIPAYTASVDAALALVERCLPGWGVQFGTLKGGGARARVALDWPEIAPLDECHDGATKPLAILLALLTALQSLKDKS